MKKWINPISEASRCLLCTDAKCTKACCQGSDPARMVRAVRFSNNNGAARFVDKSKCADCAGDCEKACIHYDMPIRIRQITACLPEKSPEPDYSNLETTFLGVKCENPFFLSSSVVASSYDMCARALGLGWAGIVYKTIGMFTPKEVSPRFDAVAKEGTPFIGFKNLEQIAEHPLEQNLDDLKRLKENFPTKVIVSSIMGRNDEEWTELARLSQEVGADIIECNFSCPHMSGNGLGSDVGENPELVAQYVRAVKKGTSLPVIAKMTPNASHMDIPAIAAVKAGADSIAAINTIKSISSLNADTLCALPDIDGKSAVSGYSGKAVKPIALRFIHDLASNSELRGVPVSGMGGIETWEDALNFIALGCSNLQVTTSVMQYGYRIIDDLRFGLSDYLSAHNMSSIDDVRGKALGSVVATDELDRATVVYPKFSKDKCVGCGRCEVSCSDAGHSAIEFIENAPRLVAKKCVGCHLCRIVCPTGAIGVLKRVLKPCK